MGFSSVWIFLLSLSVSQQSITAQTEACRTVVQADIVFLADDSWGVGQSSFFLVKDFISALISSFKGSVVGTEGVRFGVTVFGDIPRMKIALTDYGSLEEVLRAITDLPYEGGSRRIGDALQFLVDHMFSPVVSRDYVPKIAVMITNGPSDDHVDAAARAVADNGISLFAVGVQRADEQELSRIVSEPREEHLLLGTDYSVLESILPRLSRRVCFTASETPRAVKTSPTVKERVVGPRDLQVSELAHSSLRLTWSHATSDVTGYRLLVTPLRAKGRLPPLQQRQINLKSDVSTAVVTDLNPKTEYSLTVYAIYPGIIRGSATIIAQTTSLPQVSNFRVIEEGLFSLRLGWTPPLGKLSGYKIFIPRSDRPGFIYEHLLPGDTSSHVIDSLQQNKMYTIGIYAVYPQGPSEPVSIKGKTLKLVPVEQFLVQNATTNTVQARWASVKGATGYRLTWQPTDGDVENINLGDTFNFYMIQGLHPGSDYTITINPIFGDSEGPVTAAKVKTLESGAVQILKVSAVSTSSAVLSWNGVSGATGYRLAWGPTPEFVGRDRPRQLALNSSTTEYHLKNVAHDTEYVLTLYVLFGSVVGPGVSATFRTSPLGYVSNFKVTSYTGTTIDVEWSPVVGATEYKLSWNTGNASPQSRYLDRSVLFHRIKDLDPQSTYTVAIRALYGNSEGPEISLSQFTGSGPIQTVREVKIVDVGISSFTLSWKKTPGASGYKISWIPFLGGDETSQVVPAASTAFTIRNLRESSAYKIRVSSMVGSREGSPVLVTARTLDLPKVNGFAALNTTDSSTVLNWTHVAGVSGYLLTWRHLAVLEADRETLGPSLTSFKINDLLYGRTYIFSIRPLYGEVEGPISTVHHRILGQDPPVVTVQSVPVTVAPRVTHAVTTTTQRPTAVPPSTSITTQKPPGQPVTGAKGEGVTSGRLATAGVETNPQIRSACGQSKADIVFLVDESSSIGANNFIKMKDFILRVATYFPAIGPQTTQMAVVHYSDEPRIEFHLNDFKDRNSVLRALSSLRYEGGNTRTGKGISYVLQELFHESLGMRPDVAHVLVLITDGRAQDNVEPPSRIAHALGVSVLAVGVSNADIEELKKIAAPTSYKNVFYSPTFDDFPSVESELISSLCSAELLSEFKQHEESSQLDTTTEDPDELLKPQGPCPSQCVKGQKGEKGDGFGLGGLRFRQNQYDPFTSLKGEPGERGAAGTDGVPGLPGRPGRTGPPGSGGQRGLPGVPGDTGPPGIPGPKGQRGERGEPGYIIASPDANFMLGRKGEPGSSGPQGPPGVPGANGRPGPPGQPGPPGLPGISVKGDPRDPGEQGFSGKPGAKGDKGEMGRDGIAGLPGPIGLDGVPGLPGQKGEKGEGGIGIQGVQGPRGEPGEKGNIGLMGPLGPKGDRGEQGVQGVAGPRGKKGLKGEQGGKGERGETGPAGPQGPIGLRGPLGLKGAEGPRGPPGDPATGMIGLAGKKGVRGDTGPVGRSGPQGVKGEQGEKGEKGSPGFGIPGQRGPKGENGDRGVVGLSGKPGPKGQDGWKGEKGSPGLLGNPGQPGLRGKDGTPGTKGEQGIKGEQGPPGEPGERGLRGPLGLPGRPGEAGLKGDPGNPGPQGADGKKGEPGQPGPPGLQVAADNSALTRVMKGERGEPGQPGLRGETGLTGPRGPEGKPGLPGPPAGGFGRDGHDGLQEKPGMKGDQGQKGEPGLKGDKGDQGRLGIAGVPGLPGTPGKPGIDGRRGQPGQDGEKGQMGNVGEKGEKGDAGVNGKDGNKGEPGPPGLPGRQVLVTPEGTILDDIRQAFPIPMGPPGATGSPGMKGDKGEIGPKGEKGDPGTPGKSIEMKDIEFMFEDYGIRLPLLKALIDRLLQEGTEELLQTLGSSSKTKGNAETHNSNVIAEYTTSVTFDSQPLSESDTAEDHDLDGQFPQLSSADTVDEPTEAPTAITLNKSRLKDVVDEDGDRGSSLDINLTLINSTFNYTETQEEVSELPETVVEDVLLNPESPLMSNSGQKKKNRERGKTSTEDKREEEEYKETEDFEYEEEPHFEDPSESRDWRSNRQDEQSSTQSPALKETSSHPLDEEPLLAPLSATKEPDKASHSKLRVKKSAPWPESPVFMPGAPGGRNHFKESQKMSSGAQGYSNWNRMKQEIPDFLIYTMRERQERSEREPTEADGVTEEKRTDRDPVEEQEERSGDYEGGVEEDIGGGRGEKDHLEKMRDELERGRVEMETGKPYKYPPEYFYLKGQPGEEGKQGQKGEIGEKGQKGELGIGNRGPEGRAGPPGQKGERGQPGPPGAQGIQGIPGTAGIQGSPGPRGPPGEPGQPGREGDRGKRGKNGSPGAPGPQGPQGVSGAKGEKGQSIPGDPGAQGFTGFPGRKGEKGTPGVKGGPGILGPKGLRGSRGEKGERGLPGVKGDRGSPLQIQGPRGTKGSKGDLGERGPPGFDGDKGEKGEDGPPGIKGLKGEGGTKGALGRFGVRGPVGQKGEPGEPGINGVKGDSGEHGADGAKGDKGDLGVRGQKGSQGDDGERGLPGDRGGKGEKGFRGLPGRIGSPGLVGEKGNIGLPGNPGMPGLNGLAGRKGDKGEGGVSGVDGVKGVKGVKGAAGLSGFPGFKGSAGITGREGDKGPPGPPGLHGDQGPKGERGRRGKSKLCERGVPGTPGLRGENGSVGIEGAKGEKGEPGLSAEEVKDLVSQEVVQKCGVEYKLTIKSVDPDETASVTEKQKEPDDLFSNKSEEKRRKGAEDEEEYGEMTSPAPVILEGNGSLPNRTESPDERAAEWGQRKRRRVLGTSRAVSSTDRCLEPMSEGSCSDYLLLWYFHHHSGECRPFVYGGCGGNRNQFSSREECQTWCGKERVRRPDPN